jgi:Nitrile hydratase beta subunit
VSAGDRRAADWLPNDLGGVASAPFERVEHAMLPWEKRCHALADVLDARKIVSTEEKRRSVEALGEATINKLSYYERWAVGFANLLFAKGVISPEELAVKMLEVEQRLTSSRP